MRGVDLHPEELLDRVRRGSASAAERARVEQHLRDCEACRCEHALLAQSAHDAAPQPGDDARARRIERATMSALAARGVLGAGVGAGVNADAGASVSAGVSLSAGLIAGAGVNAVLG